MPSELFATVKEYVKQKRYVEARALLYSLPDDPIAQKFLAQLDAHLATLPPALIEAERAMLEKQYQEAETLLQPLAAHPLAQHLHLRIQSLRLEDELHEPSPDDWEFAALPELPMPPAPPLSIMALYGRLSEHHAFARLIGSLVICGSLLMIITFIALPWIDSGVTLFLSPDEVPVQLTAFEVWSGSAQGTLGTLDLSKQAKHERGFGAVRWVDRSLILLPLAAILLTACALRYITLTAPSRRLLKWMVILSLFLFLFPYLWEYFSVMNWRHYADSVPPERLFGPNGAGLRTTFGNEALAALFGDFLGHLLFSTTQQKLLGAMVSGLCLFAYGSSLTQQH